MRRIAFVLISAVTTVVMGASAALAASPHFTHGPDYTATTTELTATGQAAGLAALATTAQLTADSVVTNFHCVNHGNNFAPGHPAVESPAAGTPQAITPRNGNIKFSPTLPAFVPNAADVCPNKNWNQVRPLRRVGRAEVPSLRPRSLGARGAVAPAGHGLPTICSC